MISRCEASRLKIQKLEIHNIDKMIDRHMAKGELSNF